MTDQELIEAWKLRRDQSSYDELKRRYKNMVYKTVNTYRAAAVPTTALELEAWSLFDNAVNTYDATKGAGFSTHLTFHLRRIDRFTKKYQNVGRIPEAKAAQIGQLDRAIGELQQKIGKPPSHHQVAKHLNWKPVQVQELQNLRRGDLFEGIMEFEAGGVSGVSDRARWILKSFREELNPQEQQVYDYLTGHETKKITNTQQIALKMGVSPGRISQIRGAIARKLKPKLAGI
jgi:DNA-directed RNA polymerase sigma subunit (sigma70/sigma32)